MQHLEFPVVSFLLVPLLLCSLPSHIRARSVSLISLMLWLTAANLIRGVNSLVWAGNVFIKLEVWCDITMKVLIGFTVAVPLSVLCISRQLESIASNRQVMFTEADKRKRRKIEIILCFGVPLFFMALHYVFQGHRFDIVEDIGCNPATYISIPTIICILIPPALISLTSMLYSLAAVHHFLKRRIEFASVLHNSNCAMTPSRYFRLLLFALSDIFFQSTATLLILYFDIQNGVNPYVSWEFVHFEFSRIGLFPRILIPSTTWKELLFAWWVPPVGSILFVVLFGFGQEAISDYIAVWTWFKCRGNFVLNLFRPKKTILPMHVRVTSSQQITLDDRSTLTDIRSKLWDKEVSLRRMDLTETTPTQVSPDLIQQTRTEVPHIVPPLGAHLPPHFSKHSRPISAYTI